MDKAFKKASKIRSDDKAIFFRTEKTNRGKLDSVASVIPALLKKYVRSYPSVDNLPPFYQELIDLTVDTNHLKRSLASLDRTARNVDKVCAQYNKRIFRSKDVKEMNSLLKSAYGRVSSMVMKIQKDLKFLKEARRTINYFPTLDPDRPMVVIAGLPNVGKSQLVRAISTGRPKVASYPFTTKMVSMGHFKAKRMKYQVMDTPGLLDREHRNEAEMQAVLALELVSNLVLVVMDFNEYCGITMADQMGFFEKVKSKYNKIPVIPVESKVDVGLDYTGSAEYKKFLDEHDIQEPLRVSALTGEGIEELRDRLVIILDELMPERNRF